MDSDTLQQIKKESLKQCHLYIWEKLDIGTLHPLLCSEKLLTSADSHFLLDKGKTHSQKASYLVCHLPRKHKQWFESLLSCLQQSTLGTGHDVIYEKLISTYERLASVQHKSQKVTIISTSVALCYASGIFMYCSRNGLYCRVGDYEIRKLYNGTQCMCYVYNL